MHRSQSDHDRALECHLQALGIAERLGDATAVARSRNNIGLIHWELDQHEKARDDLERVVPVYRELGDEESLATALSNLGLILIELGEPQAALGLLHEALALEERHDCERSRAKTLGNLAFAHESLGDVDLALERNREALAIREELQDHWGRSRSLGSIAGLYETQERHDEAARTYELAALAAEQAGAREELSHIELGLSRSYEALGRHEDALAAMRRHLQLVQDLERAETARRIAELEAAVQLEAQARESAAEQVAAQLELGRQQQRQLVLGATSLVLVLAVAALYGLVRARGRSLSAAQRTYEELREVFDRLRASEERYRSVFNDAGVPKLLVDLGERRVLDANVPAARLVGVEPEQLHNRPTAELEPAWLADALGQLASDESRRVTEWHDAAGVPHHSELWSTPLELAGRPCALVTVADVTARRRADEERIRSDKLESLGLLAGGIAHDFNNALSVVLGRVSLARLRAKGSDLDADLAEAERGIDHAARLTSQLLAFAKGGAPQRSLVDVAEHLRNAVRFGLSGSNVRVEFELSEDLWCAELDAVQFEQAIGNLVINAVQAMPSGGRLTVRAENVVAERALGPEAPAGQYVRIDVEDEGDGIPAEVQHKVLDPYFTTKEDGSGLGLSTVFAVVSRHQGWMDFRSAPGEGTSFSLYVPASRERPAPIDAEREGPVAGTGSVLVMDDDPAIRDLFAALLPSQGYRVEVVGDGRAAVDAWLEARDAGRPFDLVVLDLTVPGGMGGKDTMRALRELDPDVFGVVVSGYSNDPVLARYREAGFAGSLGKPFDAASLGRLLARVLDERARRGASAARPRRAPAEPQDSDRGRGEA